MKNLSVEVVVSTTLKPIAQTCLYSVSDNPWHEELITYNTKPAHYHLRLA